MKVCGDRVSINNHITNNEASNSFLHLSIMLDEVLEVLQPHTGGIYIDGTLGGGGHTEAILKSGARVIGIDRDSEAVAVCRERLAGYGEKIAVEHGNFSDLRQVAEKHSIVGRVDGILLDIGISSYQVDNKSRGFSYMQDSFLDMRMDGTQGRTAADIVNSYSAEKLTEIFYIYGEEKWAKRIAEFIVRQRETAPVETTGELVQIIKNAVPAAARDKDQHPAKRVFQALRIEVNGELDALIQVIDAAVDVLAEGGRLCIIDFHSLEDRIVKEKFRYLASDCVCPPEFPVCKCDKRAEVSIITKKPLLPTAAEVESNPRSRSAKLRAVQKLAK